MPSNTITLNSIVRRSENHLSTEVDGEVVLLGLDRGNYYGMNKALTSIWTWIEKPVRVAEICGKMTATYAVTPEVCEKDVLKVLGNLSTEGLIEVQ